MMKHSFSRRFLWIALMAAVGFGWARTGSAVTPNVNGYVFSQGVGVSGVTVELAVMLDANNTWRVATTTDANGRWSIQSPASATPGFPGVLTYSKQHCVFNFPTIPVTLTTSQDINDVVNIITFGPLNGRVLSGTFGVPGVTVYPATTLPAPLVPRADNLAITDNSLTATESSHFIYSPPGYITTITVTPNITHPRGADLNIDLVHPDGRVITLQNYNVASSPAGAWDNRTFSSASVGSPLGLFVSTWSYGTWRLRVRDRVAGNTGTLNSWSMQISCGAVITDANGNFDAGGGRDFTYTFHHPGVISFTPSPPQVLPAVPATFRVNEATVLGQVTPTAPTGFLRDQILGAVQLRAQQPPGTPDPFGSYSVLNLADGTFDLTRRKYNPEQQPFIQRFPGTSDVLVAPSGRDMVFLPSSVTTYPGNTAVNFQITASPPAMEFEPANPTLFEDNPGWITMNVADLEQPAASLAITAITSSNPLLIPTSRITPSGTGASRTLTLTPIPDQFGTAEISVTVSDGARSTTKSFTVTVDGWPDGPVVGQAYALYLDGVNDYVAVSDAGAAVIPISGDFTVEAWAYAPAGTTGTRQFLSQGTSGNAFYLGMTSGSIRAGDGWANTGVTFPLDGWNHVAVTKSATETRLFVNGQLAGSRGPIPNPVKTEFRLGRTYGAFGEYWSGGIDEVRVWNVARDEREIRRTMATPFTGTEPNLVAYYRLNERSGIIAHDFAPDVVTQSGPQDGYLINGGSWDDNFSIPNVGASPAGSRFPVDEDTPTPIFLTALSVDNNPITSGLTYTITTLPQSGGLNRTSGQIGSVTDNPVIYTPNPNYTGIDSFIFTVSDGVYAGSYNAVLVVSDVNDIPTISAIPDQLIVEDNTNHVAFVVNDSDVSQNLDDLVVTVEFLAGSTLVIDDYWITTAPGGNRTLHIVPAKGEIGNAIIKVTVRDDPGDSMFTTFELSVVPRPAFVVRDVGTLPGWSTSYGLGISENGQVAGHAGRNATPDTHAFRYNGLLDGGSLLDLGTLGGNSSWAYGINAVGDVTGAALDGNGDKLAYVYGNGGSMTNLGLVQLGTHSEGRSINALGEITGVGNTNFNGPSRALIYTNGLFRSLPSLALNTTAEGAAINDAGQVAGTGLQNNALRAVRYDEAAQDIAPLVGGATNNFAHAINSAGALAGGMTINGAAQAFRWEPGQNPVLLGKLVNNGYSIAYGMNNFRQVVGVADNTSGSRRAILHSAEQLYDLNDLLPPDFQWELDEARAINSDGWIAGTGRTNGQTRAFLALPAWVIGRRIPRPLGASDQLQPEIDILERPSGFDTAQNSFYWSQVEGRLYAIRPVTARLRWKVDVDPANTNRVLSVGQSVWPKTPTLHVANTPSDVQPQGASIPYTFAALMYSTAADATVEPSAARFSATGLGYSVLRYLKTDGENADETAHPPVFDVVRTVRWDDSNHLEDNRPALVGDTLTYPDHFDYEDRQGYVYFETSFYDGSGSDRAYDRATRAGSIIPVNVPTPTTAQVWPATSQFVVVWYRTNRLGVAWSGLPVRYNVQWPANTTHVISIANGLGSGPLLNALHPQRKVYVQADPNLPGFNPNEEHALMAPSSSGEALYALRTDLNYFPNPSEALFSEPYALLKFKDPDTGKWRIRTYKVIFEGDPVYSGVAGNPVQPPLPLSVFMPACTNSQIISGPGWTNHTGTLYARAAGPEGTHSNLVVQWWYPMQPGFYFPLFPAPPLVFDGNCVMWQTRFNNNSHQIRTTYDIRWPDDPPILNIGETLLTPKRGLPGVKDWADASIIHDDLDPNGLNPLMGLARFYDPLSPRAITLPPTFVLPPGIKRELVIDKEYFPDLPYHLKQRLTYNPQTRELSFGGVLDDRTKFGGPDNPLLLANVMSPREKDRIQELAPGNSAWSDLVVELYDLTRNPNGVDLEPKDSMPDQDLRLGMTMEDGRVVPEQFGAGAKALTAGLTGIPTPPSRPGTAGRMNGASFVELFGFPPPPGDFTFSVWAKVDPANTATLLRGAGGGPGGNSGKFSLTPLPGSSQINVLEEDVPRTGVFTFSFDGEWHHFALVRRTTNLTVVVDGYALGSMPAQGPFNSYQFFLGNGFRGDLDEFQVWNVARSAAEIRRTMRKSLNGREDGLVAYFRFDEGMGEGIFSSTPNGVTARFAGFNWVASTAPAALAPYFLTLAENNDPTRPELPTTLYVIRVDDGPPLGDLKVLPSDNVFDERITLRHSGDFGGAPERLEFQWYYRPDTGPQIATDLPQVDTAGNISDPRGWLAYAVDNQGVGFNDITIGEGPRNGLLTMSDNWFICRYRGYSVNGVTDWSDWVGQPGGGRAQLVEGWIKRVLDGLNPFEQRSDSFHSSAPATYVNMIFQAGRRYEGPVAFNPDPNFLNSVGLIEAYTTVLERGKTLSIDGTPPVNYEPANTALLLVAGRIADFHMLLGNEAYADSTDPTIGFATDGTDAADYGVFASSVFAFQNQLDSLLEEELVLLRGRDDSAAGVRVPPVYNRLLWNFTHDDGEVAYVQTYNISDGDFDGFIDVQDAADYFPQGHGDAWGHYLTATTTYYDLLRNDHYTWVPRAESLRIGAAVVTVDYLDERKFARAAAAKAKVGAEIVNLTYRETYVDDPSGQFQGYKDTDPERAWGLFEWAQRTRHAGYLDWLMANTILPAQDPDPTHAGITKIDRTTVTEIGEISAQADDIQAQLDKADRGLNPLGLGKGVVPFDIEPNFLEIGSVTQGQTHFDQVYERAETAMNNAIAAFNNASQITTALRRQLDSDTLYSRNVEAQERDYRHRLTEIFGYPYAGDIGPGRTYPSDYNGPDLYHFMYVDAGQLALPTSGSSSFSVEFAAFEAAYGSASFYFPDDTTAVAGSPNAVLQVVYPKTAASYGLVAPATWGQRRAPGEIQLALSDLVQADASLRISLANYDSLVKQITDTVDLLDAQIVFTNSVLTALGAQQTEVESINTTIEEYDEIIRALRRTGSVARDVAETAAAAPDELSEAIGGAIRTAVVGVALGVAQVFENIAEGYDGSVTSLELSKENLELQTGLTIETASQSFEVQQRIKEVQQLLRSEPAARIEAYQQAEAVRQAATRYQAAIAAGHRLLEERLAFRRYTAGDLQHSRYNDMTFRIIRNDAVAKYRAQFDLAARYVYLAAAAYDYETQLLGTQNGSGRDFLAQIGRDRSLGVMVDGSPVVGQPGLADSLGRLKSNFSVLKGQLGLTSPSREGGKFSLRREMLRIRDDAAWRQALQEARVADLWQIPEFRRYCRPFAPETLGPQPGLVLPFSTTVSFGLNYFGHELGGGDSAYDPTYFATKIRSAGVWFDNYDGAGLSQTPRVYLIPVGIDVLRSPTDYTLATREWKVLDQKIPAPFNLGKTSLENPAYIPIHDSLSGVFGELRRFSSLRAYHDGGDFNEDEAVTDTRLVGRSVWNTQWMLIIPGGTLLYDPNNGLDAFINSVDDIRIFFQTYSYSGN